MGWRSAPAICWRWRPGPWPTAPPGKGRDFTRFIRHEPLGLVFVIAPWNYPYLTAVNSIVPALAAGNTVLLKHSAQTPLCAERFQEAFDAAGLPDGVFQHLHMSHEAALEIVGSGAAKLVAFTGSVPAGRAVQAAASAALIATNLELGGKDPAYVREDADLDHAVANLVDGACSTRAKAAAGSSGSTSTASCSMRSLRDMSRAPPNMCSAIQRIPRPRLAQWFGRRQPNSRVAKSTRPWRKALARGLTRVAFRVSSAAPPTWRHNAWSACRTRCG